MKKLAKKFLAALLTSVIAVSGIVATTAPAAAESVYDNAAELKALETISIDNFKEVKSVYYKIDIPREGTLRIKCSANYCTMFEIKTGDDQTVSSTVKGKTVKSFDVENLQKGTYYLRLCDEYGFGNAYVRELYYTFEPTEKPIISLGVTMKKGDKIQFDAITENYDGKVTWKSTKKSVATVNSKGLITAKKAGTTYIRAKMDNGDYVEIKVVVKNK